MPAAFDKWGIHFDYPDNWSVDEQGDEENPQVVIAAPETAFWHLSKHPRAVDLETLFDEALAAMRTDYKEMEVSPAEDQIEGRPLGGFDVNFYCLDLTITTWLRGFQTDEATFLLMCQAEDRELRTTGPVFRAMWTSLFRGLSLSNQSGTFHP